MKSSHLIFILHSSDFSHPGKLLLSFQKAKLPFHVSKTWLYLDFPPEKP